MVRTIVGERYGIAQAELLDADLSDADALRRLVDQLFATTEVERIEASTAVGDVASRRSLSRAGFRAEGVVRGPRRDLVRYGLLRSDLAGGPAAREVLAERDGIGLATVIDGDREVFDRCASEFDLDEDDRPAPLPPSPSSWLTIVEQGVPVGGVSWHVVSYGGTLGCLAWNLGIGLVPQARGRGIGTVAQRLLAEFLFASTELERVEASTDVDNLAEQRSLEKAGFRREGVLRGTQLRGGQRRDIVHYGLLRSDLA
jgi:RimJ/RimL family protein N-acetyltransferase